MERFSSCGLLSVIYCEIFTVHSMAVWQYCVAIPFVSLESFCLCQSIHGNLTIFSSQMICIKLYVEIDGMLVDLDVTLKRRHNFVAAVLLKLQCTKLACNLKHAIRYYMERIYSD